MRFRTEFLSLYGDALRAFSDRQKKYTPGVNLIKHFGRKFTYSIL